MGDVLKNQINKSIIVKMKKLDVQKDMLEMNLDEIIWMEKFCNSIINSNNIVKKYEMKHQLKKLLDKFNKLRFDPEEDDSIIFKKNLQNVNKIN